MNKVNKEIPRKVKTLQALHLETLLRKEDIKVADKLMKDLNVRYDRLFASISGVSTGFPAASTDLGVKNPPPIKSDLK